MGPINVRLSREQLDIVIRSVSFCKRMLKETPKSVQETYTTLESELKEISDLDKKMNG